MKLNLHSWRIERSYSVVDCCSWCRLQTPVEDWSHRLDQNLEFWHGRHSEINQLPGGHDFVMAIVICGLAKWSWLKKINASTGAILYSKTSSEMTNVQDFFWPRDTHMWRSGWTSGGSSEYWGCAKDIFWEPCFIKLKIIELCFIFKRERERERERERKQWKWIKAVWDDGFEGK